MFVEPFITTKKSIIIGHSSLIKMSLSPKKPHPQTDYIMDEAYKLAQQLNIISKGYASYSDFVPDLYPEASTDRVIDVTIFFNSLYYLDNIFGEDTYESDLMAAKPELNKLQLTWYTGELQNSSIPAINYLMNGILTFRNRLLKKSNKTFFRKITQNLFTHLQHALNPVDYTTIDEYIASRRWTGGMDATLDLYDYVYENYLPDEILENNPYFNELKYCCNLHPTLSNDIFSYPAEAHSKFNLINAILETKEADNLNQAIFKAIEIVNRYEERFRALYNQREEAVAKLPQQYQNQARAYIESLRNCISASYDWQIATDRYKHKNHFLSDLKC